MGASASMKVVSDVDNCSNGDHCIAAACELAQAAHVVQTKFATLCPGETSSFHGLRKDVTDSSSSVVASPTETPVTNLKIQEGITVEHLPPPPIPTVSIPSPTVNPVTALESEHSHALQDDQLLSDFESTFERLVNADIALRNPALLTDNVSPRLATGASMNDGDAQVHGKSKSAAAVLLCPSQGVAISSWNTAISSAHLKYSPSIGRCCTTVHRPGACSSFPAALAHVSPATSTVLLLDMVIDAAPKRSNYLSLGVANQCAIQADGSQCFGKVDGSWGLCDRRNNTQPMEVWVNGRKQPRVAQHFSAFKAVMSSQGSSQCTHITQPHHPPTAPSTPTAYGYEVLPSEQNHVSCLTTHIPTLLPGDHCSMLLNIQEQYCDIFINYRLVVRFGDLGLDVVHCSYAMGCTLCEDTTISIVDGQYDTFMQQVQQKAKELYEEELVDEGDAGGEQASPPNNIITSADVCAGKEGEGDQDASGAGAGAGGQCVICFSAAQCMVYLPCKHLCVCEGCATKQQQHHSSLPRHNRETDHDQYLCMCPVCRDKVYDAMKIFTS